MAWIYLAASEVSAWPCRHGSEPALIVNQTDTHKAFFFPEYLTEYCITDPYGATSELFKASMLRGSTLFAVDSPARTSVAQDLERVWEETKALFIGSCTGLPKKYFPHGFSLRTCRWFVLEDFSPLFDHLPIWGMIAGGRVYLPQKLEPRTSEIGGSYWVSTPRAGDGRRSKKYRTGRTLTPAEKVGGIPHPRWIEWLMGFPIDWTEIEPSVMQWYQNKRGKRLKD